MVTLVEPEEVLAHAPHGREELPAKVGKALDRGNALYEEGKYEASLDAYKSALEYARSLNANAAILLILNNLANVLSKLGHEEEALATFEAALSVSQDDWLVHYNLGVYYGRIGLHEAALKQFTEAHKLEPDATIVMYNLGHANQHLGRYHAAINFYRNVLTNEPLNYSARYNLCVSLQSAGEHESALDEVNKALEVWEDEGFGELRSEIVHGHLVRLVKAGFASWSGRKPRGGRPPVEITPGPPVSDYVIQDRG